jgi:hypothetical protein
MDAVFMMAILKISLHSLQDYLGGFSHEAVDVRISGFHVVVDAGT